MKMSREFKQDLPAFLVEVARTKIDADLFLSGIFNDIKIDKKSNYPALVVFQSPVSACASTPTVGASESKRPRIAICRRNASWKRRVQCLRVEAVPQQQKHHYTFCCWARSKYHQRVNNQ